MGGLAHCRSSAFGPLLAACRPGEADAPSFAQAPLLTGLAQTAFELGGFLDVPFAVLIGRAVLIGSWVGTWINLVLFCCSMWHASLPDDMARDLPWSCNVWIGNL